MARRLVLMSAVLAVLLLAMCASFVAAADAVPTEADFKNMKVKQLKAFLSDRGLTCQGCEEKSEFVAMAVANAAKPLLPSKVKSTPKGSFWDAWANVAFEVCESTAGVKGASAEVQGQVCDAMKNAVESLFMQHGKRTATKLRKKPEALLKTSFGEIYQSAGKRMLSKVAGYCFKNQQKCRSSSALEGLLEKDNAIKGVKLITFITNVGIENTNPMYEALKDKSLDKDEL